MSQVDRVSSNLPVPIDIGARRTFFARDQQGLPGTEFMSHLIAEHDSAAAARRPATPTEVLRTYDAGGRLKLLRLPPGYRYNLKA